MTIDNESDGKTYATMQKMALADGSFLIERKHEEQTVLGDI